MQNTLELFCLGDSCQCVTTISHSLGLWRKGCTLIKIGKFRCSRTFNAIDRASSILIEETVKLSGQKSYIDVPCSAGTSRRVAPV